MRMQPRFYGFSACVHLVLLLALPFLTQGRGARQEVVVIDFNLEDLPHRSVTSQQSPVAPSRPAVRPLPQPARQSSAPPADPVSALPDRSEPAQPVAAEPQGQSPLPRAGGDSGPRAAQAAQGVQGASPAAASAGGRPDSAPDGEQVRTRYLKAHFSYIHDLIAKRLIYPSIARRMGWSGRVVLAFVVNEDGGVGSVSVRQGSGFTVLDRSAVETVRNSAPFPRPPVAAEIVMPVVFRLQ